MAGRSISIPVSQVAKWKTTLQLVAIGPSYAAPFSRPCLVNGQLLVLWLAAAITAHSGLAYPAGRLTMSDTEENGSTLEEARADTALSSGLPVGREAARRHWPKS